MRYTDKFAWAAISLMLIAGCSSGTAKVTGEEDASLVDSTDKIDQPDGMVMGDTPVVELVLDVVEELAQETTAEIQLPDIQPDLPVVPWHGAPCQDDSDCEGMVCVPGSNGYQCAPLCMADCPVGSTCLQYGGTELDPVFVCVPQFLPLCRPCQGHADCAGPFQQDEMHCIGYGVDGDFCASPCDMDGQCPADYVCKERIDVDGEIFQGCVLAAGLCECNQWFVMEEAGTYCVLANEIGSCQGTRLCQESELSDCAGEWATEETCDGLDNDCDGAVDEQLTDGPCNIENEYGSCPGEKLCLDGEYQCDAQIPIAEECDNKDNNCDGDVDEGFEDGNEDGTPDCLEQDTDGDGLFDYEDNCINEPNPGQEDLDEDSDGDACDLDDDGDGFLDDEDCGPLDADVFPGADEECNGEDENCDGEADDGFVDTDLDGTPDCLSADDDGDGVVDGDDNCPLDFNPDQENFDSDGAGDVCDLDDDNDGSLDEDDCEPFDDTAFPGGLEVCDGVDNDCNGEVDDGFPDHDLDGANDCLEEDDDGDQVIDQDDNCPFVANSGQENNDDDAEGDACDIDDDNDTIPDLVDNCPFLASANVSDFDVDGLGDDCDDDDDNDGFVDSEDCGILDPQVYPGATEVCNGLDDDCDHEPDNGAGGAPCAIENDFGECAGVELCIQGELFCDAAVPATEDCDDIDNNCDGQVDEGTGGELCKLTNEFGSCVAEFQCLEGALQCVGTEPAAEICDGVDNDCNEEVDDGLGTTACGLGPCEHTVDNCVDGAEQVCDPMEGAEEEVCDGGDNNCDGNIDEELGTTGCGLGICEHTVENCVDGQVQLCDPLEGEVEEQCDQLDNNCNGAVDEGLSGFLCDNTNEHGTCKGNTLCQDGALSCVGQVPEAEICDGLDNNCSGAADEGFDNFDLDSMADCVDEDDDNDGDPDVSDCAQFDPNVGHGLAEVCFNAVNDDCDADTVDACVGLSCSTLLAEFPDLEDGAYWLDADGDGPAEPFETQCDMTTDGGGWTLVARLSDDDEKRWVRRYNSEMAETLWFNGATHGLLTGTDDYKNAGMNDLVAADLLLTVHVKVDDALVYGVFANDICDGENPLPDQAVWTAGQCTLYVPGQTIKSGEFGAVPGGGHIHGLMLGAKDGDSNACVRKANIPGVANDLGNGGGSTQPPEIAVIAMGSDASGPTGNPNPQGFSNWHNEGRHDFRALVQGTNIYNYGMLTTSNYGLIWIR